MAIDEPQPTVPSSANTVQPTVSSTRAGAPAIAASVAVAGGRMPIAVTARSVWVGSQSSAVVHRIDPASNLVSGELQRSEPTHVILDAFGALWACGARALDRIEPDALRVTNSYPIGCLFGMSAGFGSLWIVAGTSVVRMDPGTGVEQARIPVTGGTWGITAAAGAVWVADGHFKPGVLSRIDPNTNTVIAEIAMPVRTRNLVGTDDALWVTGEAKPGQPVSLLRVDPASNTITAPIDAPGDAVGLAINGNYVWAVGYGGDIAVVDARTNELSYHQRLTPREMLGGDRLAVGFGSIWIGNQEPGLVNRIDPGPYQ
jgi:DNA-binding beta-propeller fold protein YncE